MAGRKVQLIISVDDKDVDKVNKSVRNLGATLATIKKGKIYIDRSEVDRANTSVSNLGTTIGTALGTIAGQAVSEISRQLMDGARAVLEYSSRLEQTKIGFATLMGSSAAAEAHLKSLRDFANTTPFKFEDLTTASRRLQNVGLEASKVIPVMRDIGNAAAAAGASSAELDMITLAFSQIIAKGKLSAEEVNQLAERGIPIWKMLSDQLGKTKAEIIKMSEEGKISSEVFLKAFEQFSQANYGDAMEKQSHTFAGAMSSIKDIIMDVSNDAFAPFYKEISKFADSISRSLQEQQKDVKRAGISFGFALGEAVGEGMRRAGKEGYIANFGENQFAGARLLIDAIRQGKAGYEKGLSSFDPTGIVNETTFEFDTVTNTLRVVQSEIDKTKNKVTGVPSIADKLQSSRAANETEVLQKTISGLITKSMYFGDQTEVAAVKQQLLNQGIGNFNSMLAHQAIVWAENLDNLKAAQDKQEEYNKKVGELREELDQIAKAAIFEMAFPKATELDKFNFGTARIAEQFDELRGSIMAVRQVLSAKISLDNLHSYMDGLKDVVDFNKQLRLAFDRDIRGMESTLDPFEARLKEFAESLLASSKVTISNEAMGTGGISMFPADFASQVQGYMTSIERLQSAGSDTLPMIQKFREYLSGLGTIMLETGQASRLFTDKTLDLLIGKFQALNDAIKKASDEAKLKKFTDFAQSLDDQLVSVQRINRPLTVYEQVLRDLGRDYKDLTAEQKENLLITAQQIDAITELNRQHAEMKDFFKTSFRYIFDGDIKGMFANWADKIKDNFADKLGEVFATGILGFDPNQTSNPVAKPIVKSIDTTNKILGQILGRLGGGLPGMGASVGAGGGLNLGSIFGGSAGGGIFNFGGASGGDGGGTTSSSGSIFNPQQGQTGSINSNGEYVVNGSQAGNFLSNIRNLFSTNQGGIFAPVGNVLNGGAPSAMGGILGGVGSIASTIGGMIPGRIGSTISMAGTGMQMGAMFGPWGALIGAGAGALLGFFGYKDPKRKQDHNENMPNLKKGFADSTAQFQQILSDLRTLNGDPDQLLSQARDLRSQIAGGFGINFLSKKYKKQSASLIAKQLAAIDREPDGLMAQIIQAAAIARGAADRNKRILPEFAGGVYMSPEFRRYNGMLSGSWTGNDYRAALLADAEMVLNPMQQNNIRNAAGFDVFAGAGIPNYPRANPSRGLAGGGIASGVSSSSGSFSPNIMVQPMITLELTGVSLDDKVEAYMTTDRGMRTQIKVVKKLKKSGDI